MGTWRKSQCDKCGYEAIASGGTDCGFDVRVVTISCTECREILDAPVGTPLENEATVLRRRPRCPRNRSHHVQRWGPGEPCPRCGAAMKTGDYAALWD